MGGRKHLFLALDVAAWGRVALGLDIARELHKRGDQVVFVAHSTTASLVRTTPFPVEELGAHLGPLSQLCVESCIETEAPQSIVLCDFHSCSRYFELRAGDLKFIMRQDVPVIAMDIWNCLEDGPQMDLVGDQLAPPVDRIGEFAGRLVPVPIGRPASTGAYCGLSSPVKLAHRVRRRTRQSLNLTESDRAVLFCTAKWQHDMKNAHRRRLASALPQLLWTYLVQVDAAVRLVHVGPERLRLRDAGERYLWMPAVTPDDFDRLLGCVDLYLSANISATTIGKAIAAGVPVLVVQNSRRAEGAAEAEAMIDGVSPAVRKWLKRTVPLYQFRLWPLGYWQFLGRLLEDNPYCRGLDIIELLDEPQFVETCWSLLFDVQARAAIGARQAAYVTQVKQLPTAMQLIDAYLN